MEGGLFRSDPLRDTGHALPHRTGPVLLPRTFGQAQGPAVPEVAGGGSAPGHPEDGPLCRAFRTGRGFVAFRGYAFRGSAARQREHAQDVPPHPASDGRDPARQDAGGTGAAGGGAVRQTLRHGGDPEGQGRGQRPLPALGQGAPHPFRQPRAGQEALHRLRAVVL